VRVPFLDHHLVEYCARIPSDLKVRRLTTKYLLKRVARGVIPDEIVDKRKIGFFNRALDGWFRAQARGAISDFLLGPSPRYAEFLDRAEVERMVAGRAEGATRHDGLLLAILMLEVWLETFLPSAAPRPPARALARA
jgi:asparagine synthase (glutamine-hydrolysing)